jgi:uncharacterized phiE125 gp8 family phage protein
MLTTITPPSVEPVAIADAREHCRASAADDAYLLGCIAAARDHAERLTQKALIQRTLQETYAAFNDDGLPFSISPVSSVTSVTYTDQTGANVTLNASQYTLTEVNGLPRIVPAFGVTWPVARAVPDAVRVQYVAGMATSAAGVPAAIRQWLLLTVGYLFVQREAFDITGKVAPIPNRFTDSLLDPWRVYGF